MKILALDPAMHCGYAWSDGSERQYGVWILGGRGSDEHHGNRLGRLREQIMRQHRVWGVDKIAFEEASFGAVNRDTQAQHNELRGIIKLTASELGVPFVGYHPTTIKKFATGSGRAKKDQMIRAAKTMLGVVTQSSDVADALFVLELAMQNHRAAQRRRAAPVARVKERKLF